MLKLAIILLLGASVCLSTKIGLRDPGHWKAWNNIDLLNEYMSGFSFGSQKLESDAQLNSLAQAVAEHDGNSLEFTKLQEKSAGQNVLIFGIKLKGTTTYQQILTQDFNGETFFLWSELTLFFCRDFCLVYIFCSCDGRNAGLLELQLQSKHIER